MNCEVKGCQSQAQPIRGGAGAMFGRDVCDECALKILMEVDEHQRLVSIKWKVESKVAIE